MLTCKEASLLASKKLDKKLSIREKFNFFLHIIMCGLCKRYAKEIDVLHQLMQKLGKTEATQLTEKKQLSKQAHERIKQKMDKVLRSTEQ